MADSNNHDQTHDPSNVTNPEHGSHHIVTPRVYATVFGTLLVLTLVTVLAAHVEQFACSKLCAKQPYDRSGFPYSNFWTAAGAGCPPILVGTACSASCLRTREPKAERGI